MSDNHAVLFEDMNDKLDALLEGKETLSSVARKVDGIDDRLQRVEADVTVIKAVLTDHSPLIDNHEARIIAVEKQV